MLFKVVKLLSIFYRLFTYQYERLKMYYKKLQGYMPSWITTLFGLYLDDRIFFGLYISLQAWLQSFLYYKSISYSLKKRGEDIVDLK